MVLPQLDMPWEACPFLTGDREGVNEEGVNGRMEGDRKKRGEENSGRYVKQMKKI